MPNLSFLKTPPDGPHASPHAAARVVGEHSTLAAERGSGAAEYGSGGRSHRGFWDRLGRHVVVLGVAAMLLVKTVVPNQVQMRLCELRVIELRIHTLIT